MTQYVINIGAIPNDGTGDPLRTAFNETNLNFNQVFAAGPVLSNVRIANNTVLTTNTNGNLVLVANGTGVIQANVSVVPNLANLRNLGSALQRWNTVYTQYVDVSGPVTFDQLTVTGNLTVNGNIIQIGNLVTDAKTIQLANTASTTIAANGSGITVGANDNIATFLYTIAGNRWNTNIGLQVAGLANVATLSVNQTANAWRIEGNIITAPSGASWSSNPEFQDEYITSARDGYINLTSLYANGNTASEVHLEHGLAQIVVDNGSEYIWAFDSTGNLTLPGNTFAVNYANGNPVTINSSLYGNANVATFLANFGSNTISTTGNVTANNFIGLLGNITNLDSVNFAVENISALVGNNGVNIGAGGYNNLVVLPTEVLIQNVPLTVAGNILSTVTGGLNITANTVANGTAQIWNFGTDGRLTFPGTPRIDTDANNFEVQAAENISFEANAVVNIYTDTSGTTYQWQFGDDGNLTLPADGDLNFAAGGIKQALNEDFVITASDDESDGWSIYNVVDDGAGNVLAQTRLEFDQYTIRTDAQGAAYTWAFRDTGVLDLPGDIYGNVGGNLTIKIGDQAGSDTFIDLQTRSYVGDALISNIRIANPNVTVSTASGVYNWNFDNTGNLNLPPSGNLVGQTANNNGHITWLGNSSGDNNGYTTMRLVPDDTTGDGYLIIDPTAPNHIHIRAGGAQDNSGAQLYLGGENSYFLVENGANSNVYVASNSNQWKFDTTGVLTLPGEGVLQSLNDTVTLASLNTTTGNVNSVYLGSSGGLGFFDQAIGGNWLEIFRSGSDPEIRVPPGGGNILIAGASGSGGASGRDITITAGPADQTNYYTTAGGAVNIVGGLGATDDGGGGGPGGNVNITAGVSADPAGRAGNVNITCGPNSWVFDYSGNVTIPGNINAVLSSPAPSLNGFTSVNAVTVNATGNISGGNLTVGSGTITGGNVNGSVFNGNVAFGTGTVGGSGNITGGNISAIGNITGNYFIGNGSQLTGLPASYSNANVATFLAAYGSNTISTTGNITAGNIIGNISITGNVTGTSANVTLVAGAYSTVIDNTGVATFPGTVFSNAITNGTAFAVGNAAVNNCAVAMTPAVGTAGNYAIRDYSTANSTMYFDTTIGSANTGGQFQFRSSNAYTILATINQYGVSQPTLPAFRVYGSSSSNIPIGTVTATQGATVDYNQGSYYNNTTGIFTAPVAGIYTCAATLRVGSTSGLNQASIQKNSSNAGANIVAFWEVTGNTTSNGFGHMSMAGTTKLDVGDTLRLQVLSGNINFDSNDSYSVAFLG
jgi:hypothetical protein